MGENKAKWIRHGVVGVALAILAIYFTWFFWIQGQSISSDVQDWGVFGDFVGGIMNPIVAGAGLLLLIMTLQQNGLAINESSRMINDQITANRYKMLKDIHDEKVEGLSSALEKEIAVSHSGCAGSSSSLKSAIEECLKANAAASLAGLNPEEALGVILDALNASVEVCQAAVDMSRQLKEVSGSSLEYTSLLPSSVGVVKDLYQFCMAQDDDLEDFEIKRDVVKVLDRLNSNFGVVMRFKSKYKKQHQPFEPLSDYGHFEK